MNQRVASAKAWADAESALRSRYQGMGLYVRKQVYDRPDGVTMVVGGWAFLDGAPAMVPTDLDLLVVSTEGAGGQLDTMGRDPEAVLRILGAHATKVADPVEHWAVRVPEAERPALLAQIRALPEHTPGPAAKPAGGAFGAPMGGPSAFAPTVAAPVPVQASTSKSGSSAGLIIGLVVGGSVLIGLLLVCVVGGGMFFAMSRASEAAYDDYDYPEPIEEPYYAPAPTPAPSPVAARAATGDLYEVPLPASAPSRGPTNAPITIQIFSDFQCPFCSRVNPTVEQIVERYPSEVRIVWRHFPLAFHQNAMPAAEASVEVFEQAGDTGFWAYHDLLFQNQRELETSNLVALAGRVQGVDSGRVAAALRDHRHRARVQSDMDAVREAQMRIGTPSFLINGELVSGAQPFSRFQTAIEAARGRR